MTPEITTSKIRTQIPQNTKLETLNTKLEPRNEVRITEHEVRLG